MSVSRWKVIGGVSALVVAVASASRGAVVWTDDYTGQTAGAFPSRDFLGGTASNDYSNTANGTNANFVVNNTVGNAAPSLSVFDTATGDAATLSTTMNNFATFTVNAASATPVLRTTYDFRVDSFVSTNNTSTVRYILRVNNNTNTGTQVVIGFSYASLNDGDANANDLALLAVTQTGATSAIPPSDTTAIGLTPGVGWASGFDFGSYNSGSAADNDTNDEFYRITFDYDAVSGAVSGFVTQLSSGSTVPLPSGLSMNANLSISSSDTNDRFLLASGSTNTATAYFDNIVIEAVPEPGSLGLLALGGLLLGRRRIRSAQAL